MQINRVNNSTAFGGSIRYNSTMKQHIYTAIQFRDMTNELFNTLKAIKNDGTEKEFILDSIPNGKKFKIIAKYGKNRKLFSKSGEDVLYGIIEMGQKLFGKEVITSETKELENALEAQTSADLALKIAQRQQERANEAFDEAFKMLINE